MKNLFILFSLFQFSLINAEYFNDATGPTKTTILQLLQEDNVVIMKAAERNTSIMLYADEALRCNKEFMIKVLKKTGYASLKYACEFLKKDKDFFYWLLKNDQNGYSFKYVDKTFWNDKEVVKQVFENDRDSLQYASSTLKNDRAFMFELMKVNHYAYDYIGESLRKDKELAELGLKWDSGRLKYMDESFKDDPEIVLNAMKSYLQIKSFQYASERLRGDKKFIFSYMSAPAYTEILKYATNAFKSNKQFMLEAIQKYPSSYRWIDESLKEDRDICLAVVSTEGRLLKLLPKKYHSDIEMVEAAVSNNGLALFDASKNLRANKKIVEIAVKNNGYALRYASAELRGNSELITLARKNSDTVFNAIAQNPIKYETYPYAWESHFFEETLELLYGKDANFTKSSQLSVTSTFPENIKLFSVATMNIKTDLQLKKIAILQEKKGRENLVALYIVHDIYPINISFNIEKPADKYTIIGEGTDGKLYKNIHHIDTEIHSCLRDNTSEKKEYIKFFNSHLKRLITQLNDSTHIEFMVVNDDVNNNSSIRQLRTINYITKVRVEVEDKTLFTMYTSKYLGRNPYFDIQLANTKEDSITIFCTDKKNPKEYVCEDEKLNTKVKAILE